jgi:hypothetical protein
MWWIMVETGVAEENEIVVINLGDSSENPNQVEDIE